jgi:hypothetical protein
MMRRARPYRDVSRRDFDVHAIAPRKAAVGESPETVGTAF